MPKKQSNQRKRIITRRSAAPRAQQKESNGGSGWKKTVGTLASTAADVLFPGSGAIVGGIGKLLGFGAYTRSGAETWLASNVPAMHSTIDRGVRVTHHEYLGEMKSSDVFDLVSYPINPGMAKTFPWLCTISSAFQKWEDHGIVFYFKSTSASALNSVNTALGSVMGAVTYNPYQVAPADKVTMLGLAGVQTGKPAEDNLFPVECKMSQSLFGTKLVRSSGVDDDLAKYDAGNFHIAAIGSQAVATVGELHVVYDITLKEPKLPNFGWTAHYQLYGSTDAKPFNAQVGYTPYRDDIGIVFRYVSAAQELLVFPAPIVSVGATYLVSFVWDGTVAAAIHEPTFVFTNLTQKRYFDGGTNVVSIIPATGETATIMQVQYCVQVTDPRVEATIGVVGGGATALPTNPNTCRLYVEEVNSNLLSL